MDQRLENLIKDSFPLDALPIVKDYLKNNSEASLEVSISPIRREIRADGQLIYEFNMVVIQPCQ